MEMESKNAVRFFLGANTARGFYSLYDELADPLSGDTVWYIKGGPGNGKSTFMRRVADAASAAGKTADRFPCSGDPDSLDAIFIREARTAYVDATSPHVREPVLPGASGRYLDLSIFYKPGLEQKASGIHRLFSLYREQYARCYELLRAAELCAPEKTPGLLSNDVLRRVRDAADAAADRELTAGPGFSLRRRFLSALTCQGRVTFWESVGESGQVVAAESEYGLAGVFLRRLLDRSRELGCPAVLCPDPLSPEEPEAVILPASGISFVASCRNRPIPVRVRHRIRLDARMDRQAIRSLAEPARACEELRSGLLREAEAALKRAKGFHDELEALYRPYVDFSGVDRLCEKHMDLYA